MSASAASVAARVGHVERECPSRALPAVGEICADARGALVRRRRADHRRAVARERLRDRAADAARGAGDQRDLSGELAVRHRMSRSDAAASARIVERRCRRRSARTPSSSSSMRLLEARQHLAGPAFDDVRHAAARRTPAIVCDPAHRARRLPRERGADRVGRRVLARRRRCGAPGSRASRTRPARAARASRSAAGCSSELWNGADTGSSTPRLRAASAFASPIARSTASVWPAITICPGALKLTGFDDLALRPPRGTPRRPRRRRRPGSPPSRPRPRGTASCIACARKRTSGTASRNASAPAATSAVYSPRLWPATIDRHRPARRLPRAPHRDAGGQHHRLRVDREVESASRSVSTRAPTGPARAPPTLRRTSRARPDARRSPSSCRPTASPVREIRMRSSSCSSSAHSVRQHRAPREPAADAEQHHVMARARCGRRAPRRRARAESTPPTCCACWSTVTITLLERHVAASSPSRP